jgi:hypothetical protein
MNLGIKFLIHGFLEETFDPLQTPTTNIQYIIAGKSEDLRCRNKKFTDFSLVRSAKNVEVEGQRLDTFLTCSLVG